MAQTVKRHTVTDTGAQSLTALIDAIVAALLAEGERVVDIEFSDRAFEPCVDGECLVRLIEVTSRSSLNELADYRTAVVHPNDLDLAGQTFEQYVQAILDAWTGDGVTFQCGAFSDTGFDFEGVPSGGEGARCYVMIGYDPVECPEPIPADLPKALYFTDIQQGVNPGEIDVIIDIDPGDTRADVSDPDYVMFHEFGFGPECGGPFNATNMQINSIQALVGPGPWPFTITPITGQHGVCYQLCVTGLLIDDKGVQHFAPRQDSIPAKSGADL